MIVDAHQHLWNPATAKYEWLTPGVLDRAFTQADVADALNAAGVEATVLVQAADNVEDTENMLREAALSPGIAGVVAWVPLDRPSEAAELLDRWAHAPIVGVRHLIHRDPDPSWLLGVDEGLDLLASRGLTFDVCAETPELLGLVPDGPDRLMYGGDWPFALLAADSYAQIHADLLGTIAALPDDDRAAVLGRTAERVYRLDRTAEGR